jgi:trehalose utilization protein
MKKYLSLSLTILLSAVLNLLTLATPVHAAPIRVVVWDERQPAQKEAYGGFLGDTLAAYLTKQEGFTVKSVGLNDPEQGLPDEVLNQCDVLIWWGHQRHADVTPEHVKAILDRLKDGKLSLIALHSAHWSKPFVAAMNDRSVEDALKTISKSEQGKVKVVQKNPEGGLPKSGGELTPSSRRFTAPDGTDTLEVTLPRCVFPIVKNEGKPSHVTTSMPKHPIAKGIPATFDIPQTEVYGGPFHVPKPDAVIFEERWDAGETFTSGCAWKVGKGKVFYFRPGHETYPIYKQEVPLKIIENAVRWAKP